MQRLAYLFVVVALAALASLACGDGGDAPQAEVAQIASGDRVTISIALHDGVGQRAAMYAIEQALVTSDTVDVVPTYLTATELDQAVESRQYDVVEAPVLAVPVGKTEALDLVVLSTGVQDIDGTFLYVAGEGDIDRPDDLRGKTLGAVSLGDPAVLAARFFLQQRFDVRAGVLQTNAKQSTIDVAPVESQPTLLENGVLAAVIASQQGAYQLSREPTVRRLANVSAGLRQLGPAPLVSTVLVTYPDVVARKAEALAELNALLAQSVAYFKANRDGVSAALVTEGGLDPAYLEWWWEHYDLPLGDLSAPVQERILFMWDAARVVGDIEEYPDLATVLFNSSAAGTVTPSARADDLNRARERRIVMATSAKGVT